MSGVLSVDGLASGLDTTALIDSIMQVERRSVVLLEARQARVNNQLAAFREINTKLLAFQDTALTLSRARTFDARTVTVSDESLVTATAARGATTGSYAVTVGALARAHQIASQGYADSSSTTLGTGDIQIQIGSGETVTVTVADGSNTLEGVRDAINAADAGVSASIINDGSAAVPYRLLLTADNTGANNTITVTSSLVGGSGPEFNAASISDAVADGGNAYAGTVTSAGTYTGTTNQSYLVEIVGGGDLAAATYRISEDGGQTWGSTLSLAGGTIDVYDDANGTDLGVDATFGAGTFAAGDRFTIDAFVPTVQDAADAELLVGTGDGQIVVRSDTNTVTNFVPGLTLDLERADPATTVEIQVENDTESIVENVQAFVDSYNEAMTFIAAQTHYDVENKTAGILLGNSSAIKVQQDLRRGVLGTVDGLDAGMNGLYAVGVSVSTGGRLTLDTDELQAALDSDFDAVAKLFIVSGESTQNGIRFVAANSDTVASPTGYAVDVTQAARRGDLVGTSITDPANGGLTLDGTNNQLVVTINGTETSTLELTQKTYTSGAELAAEIAAKIEDSDVAVGNVAVTWTDAGTSGHFEIRTAGYGSQMSVALGTAPANNAAAILGLSGGTSTAGQDVAGTIDGYAAEGSGRLLKAVDEASDAKGMWVEVLLSESELGGGISASVSVIKGIGKQADDLLGYLTDPIDGYMQSKEDRYSQQLDSYTERIEHKEALLAKRRARLVAQFVALEQALAMLQSQSSVIAAQFTTLQSMQPGSNTA